MSEENKLHVLYCSLSVYFYFLLFSASYYLHIPTIASEAHYRRSAYRVAVNDTGALRQRLNFSTALCTMRLISGEQDGKHVSMQKVVTLNTRCDVACLTLQLPHITTGSFQSHQSNQSHPMLAYALRAYLAHVGRTDGRTDRGIDRLMPPPQGGGIITRKRGGDVYGLRSSTMTGRKT